MGTITADPTSVGHYFPQKRNMSPEDEKMQTYMMLFMFFGLLWIINFVTYKTGLITMISASTYYFNSNKDEEGKAEVGFAVRTTYAFHLGTVAVGAFIIAVI